MKTYWKAPIFLLFAVPILQNACRAIAGDWAQILGPGRNGIAAKESIAEAFDPKFHKIEWVSPLGQGFAGPAVIGDRVVVFHRIENKERVEVLHRTNGKSIWKRDFDAYYRGGVNPDLGPRCVPLVHAGKVIVFGAAGVAHALQLGNGEPLWTRDLYGDYGGDEGYFGAGSTPIVIGNRVLFNVGGKRNNAGIVAVNLKDGKTEWKSNGDAASYSSPIAITKNERTLATFITRLNAVIVDAADGKVQIEYPFGKRGPTVNGASPIFFDDRLFLTASYGIGARLLDISGKSAKEIWGNDSSLSSQYNTPIYHRGVVYGIHGREDMGTADLRCIAANSGKVFWSKSGFGVAHLILADNKLIALTIDGSVVLVSLTNERYQEKGRLNITSSPTRALPALSNGRLFLRDGQKLFCVNLNSKK